MFGTTELMIILGIGVLLFGASAIPKIAKSIGQARKEFEKGVTEPTTANDKHVSNKALSQDETAKNEEST